MAVILHYQSKRADSVPSAASALTADHVRRQLAALDSVLDSASVISRTNDIRAGYVQ